MILTDADRRLWEDWLETRAGAAQVRLQYPETHPESLVFLAFAAALQAAVPRIALTQEKLPGDGLPALLVGEVWRWHALPVGPKLPLFLETAGGNATPPLSEAVTHRLAALPPAAQFQVYISELCPFCPGVVRQLIPVTLALPRAAVTLIDCDLFPQVAAAAEIKAVPTIIINGLYRLTGSLKVSEVIDLLGKSDPAQLTAEALERLLTEGQAGLVADMMTRQGQIFPGFFPLLLHPEWNVRLGAIVALETIAAEAPDLARSVLEPLWEVLPAQDTAIQGDILYLVGELGDRTWIPPLEARWAQEIDPERRDLLQETRDKLSAS